MPYQASKQARKQASKQEDTDSTVDLIWWGSLRLAPINRAIIQVLLVLGHPPVGMLKKITEITMHINYNTYKMYAKTPSV